MDIQGFNKNPKIRLGDSGQNILAHKQSVPADTWKPQREIKNKTLTELKQARRQASVPDISYDLDGDGFVGNKEFVIAQRFDTNKDGRLDSAEK